MGGCRHKLITHKIEKLFPTLEFEEILLFTNRCKKCGHTGIRLVFKRSDGTLIIKKYGHTAVKKIYEELKPKIMGIYKLPNLKHLDLGPTYCEGKTGEIRKLGNDAVIDKYKSILTVTHIG